MKITIEVPDGYIVQVVKEEKSARTVTEDWLNEQREHFPSINLDRELEKAKVWCRDHKRQCTRRFFTNWVNRVDPEFYSEVALADLKAKAETIKAKYPRDSVGALVGLTDEDRSGLARLRKEYAKLCKK